MSHDGEIIKQTLKNELKSTETKPLSPATAGLVSGASAGTALIASLLWGPLGIFVAAGGTVAAYKSGNRRVAAWWATTGISALLLFTFLPFLALPLAFVLTIAGAVGWAKASK
jgi:hypothetical protein